MLVWPQHPITSRFPSDGVIVGVAASTKTINDWLKSVGLNFEASPSQGTVPQWIFRRKK
jgi:hypothetical protein